MASLGATSIFVGLLLLPQASLAATLTTDRVVRREPTGVQLTSEGEIELFESDKSKLSSQDEETVKQRTTDFCLYDYPVGVDKTSTCIDGGKSNELLIDSEDMCMHAASKAGATTVSLKFRLHQDFELFRPKGCFKETCAHGNGACYFFNPVAADVSTIVPAEGTPICYRPRYQNGTEGVAGKCGELHAGYELIDEEQKCRAAAGCLNDPPAHNFIIGMFNGSKHLDYVRGCFFDDVRKQVFWNPKNDLGPCTSCTGTQLCVASSQTSWAGHDGGAVTADDHQDSNSAHTPAA